MTKRDRSGFGAPWLVRLACGLAVGLCMAEAAHAQDIAPLQDARGNVGRIGRYHNDLGGRGDTTGYLRGAFRRATSRRRGEVDACLALAAGHVRAVSISASVAERGRVMRVHVTGPRAVATCVARFVRSVRFPRTNGGGSFDADVASP